MRDPLDLPLLPLVLWRTPPGLELALAQEGVPYEVVERARPAAIARGRFVLFDSAETREPQIQAMLCRGQTAIDVDFLRDGQDLDPFAALVDDRAVDSAWSIAGARVVERVARRPKAAIRRALIERLRDAVTLAGGAWIRLAPFPYPYRSAFSFRADLDEPAPGDYHRFARARQALDTFSTQFVSTQAYAHHDTVIADLRRLDTQSHGHFHFVHRDFEANRANLERADRILRGAGIEPLGFAAPHGRYHAALDDVLEELGYLYSSEFQLAYDDFPFFPWKRDRFSRVLQIPIHPVCEGLFLEAGVTDPDRVGAYFDRVVRARTAAGELVVIYGHPEGRLARMTGVVTQVAAAAAADPLTWRVTFTDLARYWRWRGSRRWLVLARERGKVEIQFEEWDARYPLAVVIERGGFRSVVPQCGPRLTLDLASLAYERISGPGDGLAAPEPIRRPPSLKRVLREALDWETTIPIENLPTGTLRRELKRSLRRFKQWHTGAEA